MATTIKPKIDSAKFMGTSHAAGNALSKRVENNSRKITLIKNVLKAQKIDVGEKITPTANPISAASELEETNAILLDIGNALALDFSRRITDQKDALNADKKRISLQKQRNKENILETTKKIGKTVSDLGNNIIKKSGFGDIFGKIWDVAKILTAGVLINNAFEWLKDPENQKTLKNIFDFTLKALPWLAGALVFNTLFNGFRLLRGAIGLLRGSKWLRFLNFARSPASSRITYGAGSRGMVTNALRGSRVLSGLRFAAPLQAIFSVLSYFDRKENLGQSETQAVAGASGELIGGLTGVGLALALFPEPITTAIGVMILGTLGAMGGGKVADDITGVNRAIGGQSSGWTWVGENGPELLNLPLNSHVVANHQLNRLKGPGRRVVTEVVNLPTEYRTTPVKATSNTPATKIQVINPINVGNRHMVEVPREFGFSGILQLQG